MPASEILFKSVAELAPLLKTRKLSPVEVVRAFLDQIEAAQSESQRFYHRHRRSGARAGAEGRKGDRRRPLPRTAARRALRAERPAGNEGNPHHQRRQGDADWIPDYESTVTARLNQAGAILIGKLNLLEFAMGSGQRGLAGPARNPWDLSHSPSGSSSGSGAALAAGMVPLAIGTDSGGSIRSPARSCGIVGLKPTYGRVSRFGVTTLSWTLDHVGPMAKTVADVGADASGHRRRGPAGSHRRRRAGS